ncbi:hypothetical protein [Deinococcus navajonensis]|uniref:Pentapeptide repeat protein n=1 Tax=Deinococcus navajonensis TaxID=309884 RepID=A0ABV8XK01_9DEIO
MTDLRAERALAELREGRPLTAVRILDELGLGHLAAHDDVVHVPITFRHCELNTVFGSLVLFEAPVTFEHCMVGEAIFHASYFLGGATFTGCTFTGPVTFDSGGHNDPPTAFVLEECTFQAFVDFFDVWFPGPLIVRDCHFAEGTNLLLYTEEPFGTTAEFPSRIYGNTGTLNCQGSHWSGDDADSPRSP